MVRRLLALRPEERRGTVAAFLTIFGTLAAHTLLETARDALFLARLPAPRLAVVYLLIAFVAVGLAQVPWGRRRATGAFALSRLLGLGAVVTFLFWALGRWQSPFELYALYVWTGWCFARLLAPFAPHLAEELWHRARPDAGSLFGERQ